LMTSSRPIQFVVFLDLGQLKSFRHKLQPTPKKSRPELSAAVHICNLIASRTWPFARLRVTKKLMSRAQNKITDMVLRFSLSI
jgi:hypothetical protein